MAEYAEFDPNAAPSGTNYGEQPQEFDPDGPWWERVTPYTGILYVDYFLSHQMTPLFVMFLLTIAFRYGLVNDSNMGVLGRCIDCYRGDRSSPKEDTDEKRKGKKKKRQSAAGDTDDEAHAPLRIGAIGNISEVKYTVMEASKKVENLEVYAHSTPQRQHQLAFAQKYKDVLRGYTDTKEFLRTADISAVFVGLYPTVRFRWSKLSLINAKHVLCLSPIACNGEEAAELVKLAEQKNVVLQEALHHRHHPIYQRFHAACARLGPATSAVVTIHVPWWAKWYYPFSEPSDETRAGGGGGAFDLYGPFVLDIVRTMFDVKDSACVVVKNAVADVSKECRDVDTRMKVELEIQRSEKDRKGPVRTARLEVSYGQSWWPEAMVEGVTPKGSVSFYNFMLPQIRNYVSVKFKNGFSYNDKCYSAHNTYKQQLINWSRSIVFKDPIDPDPKLSPVFIADLHHRVYVKAGLAARKSYLGTKGWAFGDPTSPTAIDPPKEE